MLISAKHKKMLVKCEECRSTAKLESAHVQGKERPLIISNILSQFIEDGMIRIDLTDFEERFVDAHHPIETTIRILCSDSHRKYDNEQKGRVDTKDSKDMEAVNEAKLIGELVSANMNKTTAIHLVNEKTGNHLQYGTTLFSNINSAVDTWWLEPLNDKFKTDLFFILNHPDTKSLFLFHLPPNVITDPKRLFYQRNDSDYSKIFIEKSTAKFVDRKGFDIGKYKVDTIAY